VSGEPADAAGLREGDLITAIDAKPVSGAAELRGLVREHRPGERSTITVTRGGRSLDIAVTFGSRPSN
jgi:putative serine protease PepD